jgi:hypothetical protein
MMQAQKEKQQASGQGARSGVKKPDGASVSMKLNSLLFCMFYSLSKS